MKKVLPILVGILFLLSFSSSAIAAGNWRNGKQVYKDDCMSCHKRGGDAKRLQLNKRSKAGWTKFVNTPQAKHEALLNGMSAEQKEDLLQYFLKYAKDDNSSHLGCG